MPQWTTTRSEEAMSKILKFSTQGVRRTQRPIGPDEAMGAIVFFTGVRFERQVEIAEDTTPASDGAKSGRRRKA